MANYMPPHLGNVSSHQRGEGHFYPYPSFLADHVSQRSATIEVPVDANNFHKLEFPVAKHLLGVVVVGIQFLGFSSQERTPLNRKVVSDRVLKNSTLTLLNESGLETHKHIPMGANERKNLSSDWYEVYLPYSDLSRSYIQTYQPSGLNPLNTDGNKDVEGTLEYEVANNGAFMIQVSYITPVKNCPQGFNGYFYHFAPESKGYLGNA